MPFYLLKGCKPEKIRKNPKKIKKFSGKIAVYILLKSRGDPNIKKGEMQRVRHGQMGSLLFFGGFTMNELIKVTSNNDRPTVSGRELHAALEIGTEYDVEDVSE